MIGPRLDQIILGELLVEHVLSELTGVTTMAMNRNSAAVDDRAGSATVELATCLPLLVLLVEGTIQVCDYLFLEEALTTAAYAGTLEVSRNGSTEVQNRSGEVWNGHTVIASGIDLGTEELINGASARQYAEKVMIVLTDGHPTSGDAVAAAADAHDARIRVFAVTFGDYANQSYMPQVADVGGGYHEHASDQQASKSLEST